MFRYGVEMSIEMMNGRYEYHHCFPVITVFVISSLEVNFGWNTLEFCTNNDCIVEGYLLDYDPPMPHAYICMVESMGERMYAEGFRGGTNELEAAVDLPDVSVDQYLRCSFQNIIGQRRFSYFTKGTCFLSICLFFPSTFPVVSIC